jgi:hypothetical protein
MPANAIYVGRPAVWGNPYVVGSELMNGETLTTDKAVELYEQHLADNFSERDIRALWRVPLPLAEPHVWRAGAGATLESPAVCSALESPVYFDS